MAVVLNWIFLDQGVQTAAISVADADMQTAGSVAHSATQSMPRVVAPVSKEQLLAGRERMYGCFVYICREVLFCLELILLNGLARSRLVRKT